ncbi:hypothetical protein [Mucilaginibacter rubeus]|uniref:Uncharacterized protein n=1 Tax=Mucilaginibacter rubeus TaxID=2027860 RepID=A0A5C1HYT7_9SPHI|nr:hypothetical protein [Mucilaginibacter rubeus]QEM11057.1 hypothetical protein DEO27_013845 [Mucilaginibacter rubeus]
MLLINLKTLKTAVFGLLIILSVFTFGCGGNQPGQKKRELISFRPYNGINYSEVSRRQRNGLSFNEYGYQLEPQWKLKFVSDDSVSIFSPTKNAFINFPLTRGYDSIFNAARSWLKIRQINKDSITMEILIQKGDSLDVKGTKVFMRFFADNYVKNVLHTDTTTLRKPSRADTLFIHSLAAKATADYTKAFSARQPAEITSKSPLVTVSRRTTKPDILNNFDNSDDYLDPNYDIVIKNAYKDFYFSFTMYIDDKGNLYYGAPLVGFNGDQEREADYIHTSKAVMESYFKFYLNVKPGKTLGIIHSSMVSIHVEGKAKNHTK